MTWRGLDLNVGYDRIGIQLVPAGFVPGEYFPMGDIRDSGFGSRALGPVFMEQMLCKVIAVRPPAAVSCGTIAPPAAAKRTMLHRKSLPAG